MKLLTVALKDRLHALRSPFTLVMMFVAPLLIVGLLYFAFGAVWRFDLGTHYVSVQNIDNLATRATILPVVSFVFTTA